MSQTDALTRDEVEAEVRTLSRGRSAGDIRPLALLGAGGPGTIVVDGAPWDIVPVRGELELRHQLVSRSEGDTLTVFLVDFADALPLDVTCRLQSNTVHRVTLARRLASRFGARSVTPGLAQSALARRAVQLADGRVRPITHATLTADDLWEAVLASLMQAVPPRAELREWLSLALVGTGASAVRAVLEADPALATELGAWLGRPDRTGAAAEVLRRAWVHERGVELAAWLLLLQAAHANGDGQLLHSVRVVVELTFDKDLATGRLDGLLLPVLDDVLTRLESSHPDLVAKACALAEERAASTLAALTRRSRWLRGGYRALRDELAAALEQNAHDPAELAHVWKLVDQLASHRASTQADRNVIAHGARLATWCAWRAARPLPEPQETWTDLIDVARAYQSEGGHVDWSRAHVRAHALTPEHLDVALRAVLARADALRDADDARFSRALLDWHQVGRPSKDVLPLHQVTKEVARRFLDGAPHRRLLVVLMDGMSRANLAQLQHALEGWQPLKSQDPRPVLASLPTLTGVSRSAFFAGREHASHVPGSEGDDAKRWAQNPAMAPFAGPAGPALVVKRELTGDAPERLGTVLASDDRVAAVIVNAVDDDLSGAQQIHAELTLEQVPVLSAILKLAAAHRRAVLLVADHGHVAGPRLRGRKPPGTHEGGKRHRVLAPGEAPLPEELELPASAWRPKGSTRSAALWREDVLWGSTEKGAHGGLSLSEVVVPCVLLAPPWLAFDVATKDSDLETVSPAPPPWWSGALPNARRAAPAKVHAVQPALFPNAPPPPVVAPAPAPVSARHALVDELERNALFVEVSRGRNPADVGELLRALDALLSAPVPGQLPVARFADAMGKLARRVPSLIARIQYFQLDGVALVECNQATQLVTLHVERLKSQFGLAGTP